MFACNSWAENDDLLQAGARAWGAAACHDGTGSLTPLFFSEGPADIGLAKAICATCRLVVPCLEGALERREPAGVWGGQLFANGEVLAYKRGRGRPPKAEKRVA